jgi:hypothetical protein
VCETALPSGVAWRKHRNITQAVMAGPEPAASGDRTMTTSSMLLTAAILAQPMLVIGIMLTDLIRDRRAA